MFNYNDMEGVSRWLCSFFADEVTVHQHERTITCGEKLLLCSLSLTNPKSTFTNYHQDKIAVLYCNGNRETRRHKDCKWSIEVNPELINVYFTAYRAGNVSVKLDLKNGTYSRVRKTNKYKNKWCPRPLKFCLLVCPYTAKNQKLLKTGCNNVVGAILFNVVNNSVRHCYT